VNDGMIPGILASKKNQGEYGNRPRDSEGCKTWHIRVAEKV
jgi:hypothetical protein